MPATNNGARINYGYLLLETSIKSLNIFKLINRSNILMLNALFIALLTILSVHLMDAKKTIIQLIINDLMTWFMAVWLVFTFALANAVAVLCQLRYVFKLVSLKELGIAE